jgi:hypothetical protein
VRSPAGLALLLGCGLWILADRPPALAQDDEAALAALPDHPGKEETYYTCDGCHSFRLVSQQRLPRARWDQLLDWMVEEQGMAELAPEDRALILDYLEHAFGQNVPRS